MSMLVSHAAKYLFSISEDASGTLGVHIANDKFQQLEGAMGIAASTALTQPKTADHLSS
jgi:hypothetical protein